MFGQRGVKPRHLSHTHPQHLPCTWRLSSQDRDVGSWATHTGTLGARLQKSSLNLSGNHWHSSPQAKHHLQLPVCPKQLFKQDVTHRRCTCESTVWDPTSILKDPKSHWLKFQNYKDCGIILGYILQPRISPLFKMKSYMGLTVKVLQTPPLSPAAALLVYQKTKVKSRSTRLHKEKRKPVWHVLCEPEKHPVLSVTGPTYRRHRRVQPSPLTASHHRGRALFPSPRARTSTQETEVA